MTNGDAHESVSDYARFDFAALWRGRERVTEVERAIVSRQLGSADRRRILELGTGFGRLLSALTELGGEVVATDFDVESLNGLPASAGSSRPLRVAANIYHLPFVDGAFTSASMVRVYHHLSDPVAALTEVGRVLQGGGRFLVSYNPKPTLGTLVNDIQRAIHPSPRTRFRSITFARGPVTLDPEPFPVYVASRREFERTVRAGGFRPVREVVSGLEEYYLMRHVPAGVFVRLGTALGRAPAFPARFAVLEKDQRPGASLPDLERILACPRCRTPFPTGSGYGPPVACACGYRGTIRGAVLDLRYVPEGVRRWEAPT